MTTQPPFRPLATDEILFDSRSLVDPANTVFCALRTKSADGHSYISSMYRNGVRKFLVENIPANINLFPDAQFIKTNNVAAAIENAGKERRKELKGKIIGITGSAGKTVVKEMIYRALASNGIKSSRSPGSWNSRLGVPLTLLEADNDDTAVIVEVGIDTVGDMEHHADTLKPEIGILASITSEHEGGFSSKKEKIQEKLKLFKNSDTIIYDAADSDVDALVAATYPDKKLIPVIGDNPLDTDRKLAEKALSTLGFEKFSIPEGNVVNRINVHESVNDCVLFFYDFTNDIRSLRLALDFMRRRSTPVRTSTVIMSDLFHGPMSKDELSKLYDRLGSLLDSFGIRRVIAIGTELGKYRNSIPAHISVENLNSASDFIENYDINRFSSESILIFGQPQKKFREIKTILESPRHDSILEINLDSLIHNFNHYKSMLRPGTGIVAMIKASAYGTGAVEVAKTLQAQGARYLAVAVIDEGIELRRAGITMPIVVLNPVTTNYRALFSHGLEPSVFSIRELDTLISEARKAGVDRFAAHIKLDTGMHRVGFTESELPELISRLGTTPELTVASVFSHLATADSPDESEYTQMQLDTFARMSDMIVKAVPYPVMRHILNTAGIITHPESQYDMVRLGIGLYGVSPLDVKEDLRPVATLKTTIISIKKWPAGTTIGYGRRGVLERDSVIATLPIGYADGLDRHLSRGAAGFLVRGVECPTVGNICMDQCMIDITDANDATIGDEVEIFGEHIPVERLAGTLDTIPYEILTSVSPRVRRIYFRD